MTAVSGPKQAISSPKTLKVKSLRTLAFLLAAAMLVYGLVAIETGFVNFRSAENPQVLEQRHQLIDSAEAGRTEAESSSVRNNFGSGFAVVEALTSPRFAYGEQGLGEIAIQYAEMPRSHAWVLSVHNVVGGIVMLFGAFQFWPAFRRRFPRWHRTFGMVYVVGATIGMITAMTYLVLTPVENIFDELTFVVGLWFLAITTLASIWLGMYHLWRKEIPQHQGYMAISYGALLTAPLLRYFWLIGGLADPNARLLESNFAGTSWLLPFSLMAGYGLFTINRLLQSDRPESLIQRAEQAFVRLQRVGHGLVRLLMIVVVLGGATTVWHFVYKPGLAVYIGDPGLIPAGVVTLDQLVIADGVVPRLLFAFATVTGLMFGWRLLQQAFLAGHEVSSWVAIGLTVSLAFAGMVMVYWGFTMGMPSFETLAGGANWMFGGVVSLMLSGMLAWAIRHHQTAWVREWGVCAIMALLGAPVFYWLFPVLLAAGIPDHYIETGHLFRLASYGQWLLPLFLAFVYSIYGRATLMKFAR